MHRFSHDEIRSATNNFDPSRIIDSESYEFYRGRICVPPPRQAEYIDVAISTMEISSYFATWLRVLPELKHRNLLTPIGYCDHGLDCVDLVYEFPSGGRTLSEYLSRSPFWKNTSVLSWTRRLKICVGVARGLNYVHGASIFLSVDSSRILLDDNLNAKIPISDISRRVEPDLYNFGLLLLDVLHGRSHSLYFCKWVFKRGMKLSIEDKIIDPMLKGQITPDCLDGFLHIVQQCVGNGDYLKRRPTMVQVVARLESLLALQESTDFEREKIAVFGASGSMEVSYSLVKQKPVHTASDHDDHHWGSIPWQAKQDLDAFHSGGSSLRRFSLTEMKLATKNFSPVLVIGQGGYSFVYKGSTSILDQQNAVAIKRWVSGSSQSAAEFLAEIRLFSEVRHKHVVSLLGYCNEDSEMILVYEYMVRGPLQWYLHNESALTTLSWVKRLKICIGAARGLDYLHFGTNFEHGVIHRNVNSSNILLDMAWKAKISDFSLSKVTAKDESRTHNTSGDKGWGYIDPAYRTSGILTTKTDVYCLGVVLYEVLCGRKLIDSTLPEDDKSLLGLVQHYRDEGALNRIIDPKIHGQILPNCLDAFVQIADKSLHKSPNERPTMAEVVAMLEFVLALQEGTEVDGTTALWGDADPMGSLINPSKRIPFDGATALLVDADPMESLIKPSKIASFGGFEPLIGEKSKLEGKTPTSESLFQSSLLHDAEASHRHDNLSGEDDISNISELSGPEKSSNINFTPKKENSAAEPSRKAQDGEQTSKEVSADLLQSVHPAYLKLEEWNAREINLADNELSELPENPHCPILVKLILKRNHNLTEIPPTFFNFMPVLRVLDLSNTSIKCLPRSVSKLTTIQELYMRDCNLLMELPPEIGAFKNLKIFDLEGTELIYLPKEMENLADLEHFKVSLYQCADMYKESKKVQEIVPLDFLLKLTQLKELSIYVHPDGEWWDAEVERIIDMLSKLSSTRNQLEILSLHFPSIELFNRFIETKSREGFYIYPSLNQFRFIVGRYQEQIICHLPPGLEDKFLHLDNCLQFTGCDEGDTSVINKALRHARALLLDRHWTLQSLSSFEIEAMDILKFCLLLDCNEMQMIVDESAGDRKILGSLQYLALHYMKNIDRIWKGPLHDYSLRELRTLIIHTCPEFTTVFTIELLSNLSKLEYLMVKDCPSLVSLVPNHSTGSSPYLPNLKKILLIYLPELVSISSGVCIAPKLEKMTVFDCPKLESFSAVEVSSNDLKVINGESHWWDALKWCEPQWASGRPELLTRAFVPLQFDGNLMDELEEHVNLLQQWIWG